MYVRGAFKPETEKYYYASTQQTFWGSLDDINLNDLTAEGLAFLCQTLEKVRDGKFKGVLRDGYLSPTNSGCWISDETHPCASKSNLRGVMCSLDNRIVISKDTSISKDGVLTSEVVLYKISDSGDGWVSTRNSLYEVKNLRRTPC